MWQYEASKTMPRHGKAWHSMASLARQQCIAALRSILHIFRSFCLIFFTWIWTLTFVEEDECGDDDSMIRYDDDNDYNYVWYWSAIWTDSVLTVFLSLSLHPSLYLSLFPFILLRISLYFIRYCVLCNTSSFRQFGMSVAPLAPSYSINFALLIYLRVNSLSKSSVYTRLSLTLLLLQLYLYLSLTLSADLFLFTVFDDGIESANPNTFS